MSQANLPSLVFAQGPLAIPDAVAQSMAQVYSDAFTGFGTGTFRRIKVRKTDFLLVDGKNQEIIQANDMVGVLVGAAPTNHAVWYEKDYLPGQEPEKPDLVWLMPTPDTFPDALPVQFRKKILRNGAERWAFQILRRVAFVLMRNINGQVVLDLERPYVLDLTSMSMFGKGLPEQNLYKWGGLGGVCAQHSMPGMQVTPSMFLTQIVIDPNTTVNGVVMFRPNRDATGQLRFLDPGLIMSINDCIVKQSTRDLLVIQEKLTYGPDAGQQTSATQQVQQPGFTSPPPGQVLADAAILQSVVPQHPGVVAHQSPAEMLGGFAVPPVNPAAQVANPPSTVIQTPQPVGQPTIAADLLAQAQQVLAGQQQVVQPTQPATPVTPPQGAVDPSVAASISGLLAALNPNG